MNDLKKWQVAGLVGLSLALGDSPLMVATESLAALPAASVKVVS
ncbi:hypothetical protein [Weissella confusa]|nr:hypothetical protein [Weissella confusa]